LHDDFELILHNHAILLLKENENEQKRNRGNQENTQTRYDRY